MASSLNIIKGLVSLTPLAALRPLVIACIPFAADQNRMMMDKEMTVFEVLYNCEMISSVKYKRVVGINLCIKSIMSLCVRGVNGIKAMINATIGMIERKI